MNVQTDIYTFLGMDKDPLFNRITRLKSGESLEIGEVKILLNQNGIYELETESLHECFMTHKQLYDGLAMIFSFITV